MKKGRTVQCGVCGSGKMVGVVCVGPSVSGSFFSHVLLRRRSCPTGCS